MGGWREAAGRSRGLSPRGPFLLAEPIPGAGQGDPSGSSAAPRSGPQDVVGTLQWAPFSSHPREPHTLRPPRASQALQDTPPDRHGYSSSGGTAPASARRSCLAHGLYRRQGRTRGLALAIQVAPLPGPAGQQDLPLTLEPQHHPKAGREATAPADGVHWPAPGPWVSCPLQTPSWPRPAPMAPGDSAAPVTQQSGPSVQASAHPAPSACKLGQSRHHRPGWPWRGNGSRRSAGSSLTYRGLCQRCHP